MNSDILRDKAEYLMSLISHFAERNGLSIPQVYRYVKRYGGICLVDEHYDIMHTLRFDRCVGINDYVHETPRRGCGMINLFLLWQMIF